MITFHLPSRSKFTRKALKIHGNCSKCGAQYETYSFRRKYCDRCAQDRIQDRGHGNTPASNKHHREVIIKRGLAINQTIERKTLVNFLQPPELLWQVRFWVPFHIAGSKNARLGLAWKATANQRLHMRGKAKKFHNDLVLQIQSHLKNRKIVQAKLWIDIFVQKPNHKSDAVNFVDTICDAMKVATGLDDRWYSLRSVDWSITKDDEPAIFICVGQEVEEDCKICQGCGRQLPFSLFRRSPDAAVGHKCLDCTGGDQSDLLIFMK